MAPPPSSPSPPPPPPPLLLPLLPFAAPVPLRPQLRFGDRDKATPAATLTTTANHIALFLFAPPAVAATGTDTVTAE